MRSQAVLLALLAGFGCSAFAAQDPEGWKGDPDQELTFTADRIIGDSNSRALMATGHVHAVYEPLNLHGHCLRRHANGLIHLADPTDATTCTNYPGLLHWRATGEIEYLAEDHVLLRNFWVRMFEIPVLWLPYFYYPLDTDCGFSWMPGYLGRWGAFLLTRYRYHIAGDVHHQDYTYWLKGGTRFDLRYRTGLAFGEDLEWNLGDFGHGRFGIYYAWDDDAESRYGNANAYNNSTYGYSSWGSNVERDRYCLSFGHDYEPTERDRLWLQAAFYSDTYVRTDFFRKTMLNYRNDWHSYESTGLFWDHVETSYAFGGEVSGRLNDFYEATGRLPEFYFDVNPLPVFGSPVNYESQTRFGYLTRNPAEYGSEIYGRRSVYQYNPGPWAEYDAFRVDTYHRFTCPFRTFDDLVSVVPRLGVRGTYWSESGATELTGRTLSRDAGNAFRTIGEAGSTFATRGVAWVNDEWRHLTEPYFDVLAQHAWLSGVNDSNRPYVFDNLDSSMTWEDQFAGRGRNLPYTYYGVTPGWRNAWSKLDDRGSLHQIVDFDVYAALNFGETKYCDKYDSYRLAKAGYPNYGKNGCHTTPGARLRWTPDADSMLGARAEYDTDRDRLALADVSWNQRITADFSYRVTYGMRDFRFWDFSNIPHDDCEQVEDSYNWIKSHYLQLGFTQHPIDWFQWSPFIRWDLRDRELDAVGGWFDLMTDCLGFRIQLEYMNEYVDPTGYRRDEDYSISFYIYLRAFGADSANLFME